MPTFPCAHNQVFILLLIKEAQGLLGSSKSWILGQGRGCAWDILLFLEGNVSLNKHCFLKKGMTKIQSEEGDLECDEITRSGKLRSNDICMKYKPC